MIFPQLPLLNVKSIGHWKSIYWTLITSSYFREKVVPVLERKIYEFFNVEDGNKQT